MKSDPTMMYSFLLSGRRRSTGTPRAGAILETIRGTTVSLRVGAMGYVSVVDIGYVQNVIPTQNVIEID